MLLPKHSPKNFRELRLSYSPKKYQNYFQKLELANRIRQKIIFFDYSVIHNIYIGMTKNKKIIEKYIELKRYNFF